MNWANQNPVDANKTYVLRAARILEPRTGEMVRAGFLVVRGACIVGINAVAPSEAEAIDLGDVTLLPGLIDMHTHLLLRDEDQTWPYSILWKTSSYRIIEGVNAAIKTLNIGFTTVRDLDNEGAMFGDTALRDAVARGVFPGPRMLVAGQPLTITGGDMNLPLINPEIRDRIPQPADMADSREAMIAFTRKEITRECGVGGAADAHRVGRSSRPKPDGSELGSADGGVEAIRPGTHTSRNIHAFACVGGSRKLPPADE